MFMVAPRNCGPLEQRGNAKLCMRGWRGKQRPATSIQLLWWVQWHGKDDKSN